MATNGDGKFVGAIIGGFLAIATASSSPWWWDKLFPSRTSETTVPPPTVPLQPAVSKPGFEASALQKPFSQGSLVVHGTWNYDLDLGIQTEDPSRADFWWEQKTNVERSLVPKNGATFLVIGIRDFDSFGYTELTQLNFSAEVIRGDATAYNRVPQGTVVAYRTKQGRLGKFRIENYGYDLTIQWVTFAAQ